MIGIAAQQLGEYLASFFYGIDILKLLGIHDAGGVVRVCQGGFQIGGGGAEGDLRIDLSLLNGG